MVVKKEAVLQKLKELDRVLQELSRYRGKEAEDLASSLSLRWTVERGLIIAAGLVFDTAEHILAGRFGVYPESYEDSLRLLREQGVITASLYRKIKGLGGFRNILVHDYVEVDIQELARGLRQAFQVFPGYSAEIQEWLRILWPV